MNHDPDETTDATESAEPAHATDAVTDAEASDLAAYDLDGDGKISLVEEARATLGVVDARLEQVADEGGAKGKIADAVHHVVDKLDND